MLCTIADACDSLETDIVVREDEIDSSASQRGHSSHVCQSSLASNGSMTVGSSKTLQQRHGRPTDFVHRTRDAGCDDVYCRQWSFPCNQY